MSNAASTPGSPIADIVGSATRVEREAKICVAGGLNARFAQLEEELAAAMSERRAPGDEGSLAEVDPRRQLAEELERIRAEMQKHEHTFTMRALEPQAWSDLTAEHQPRTGRLEQFNLDTFPVACIAASCYKVDEKEVTLTEEHVAELFTVINQGQRDELFNAAWGANTGRVSVPFSRLASAVLESTAPK